MSYQVLARKYRSATFDQLVGQEAVATTLFNAIQTQRVHHGYLFTGTRGVGKTSAARILAKALNCLSFDAPTPTPCCRCDACTLIAEGEDIDVVEIDAASNTGVDNIRDLRNNTAFRPARSRFKVYIIDEVHMLSTGAFNALLKTLEEPPEHVKFILATTELQKVPATIQSRCQRFDFRPIPQARIAEQLRRILDAEGITAQEDVLRRVSRLANGSMRDALSLLDKVLSFSTGDISGGILDELLPPVVDELSHALVSDLAAGDAGAALRRLDESLSAGNTLERTCELLLEHVRKLMILRVCGADTDLLDLSESQRGLLTEQAGGYDPPVYVYMLTMLEDLRRAVRTGGAGRALVEAALVRLSMASQFTDIRAFLSGARSESDSPGTATGAGRGLSAAEKKNPADLRSAGAAVSSAPIGSAPPSARAGVRVPSEAPSDRGAGRPLSQVASVMAPPSVAPPVRSASRGEGRTGPGSTIEVTREERLRRRALKDGLVREAMARFDAHIADVIPASEPDRVAVSGSAVDGTTPPPEAEAPLFEHALEDEEHG